MKDSLFLGLKFINLSGIEILFQEIECVRADEFFVADILYGKLLFGACSMLYEDFDARIGYASLTRQKESDPTEILNFPPGGGMVEI
ncbi:hypothetical protein [Burkholderia arboris]|uniref:hypothetical protein n=1 Tax=Burkholderia arboris TaxID=488730 RepID=UPI001583766B|nr:hypothetical protein [Burkholderia arboris]